MTAYVHTGQRHWIPMMLEFQVVLGTEFDMFLITEPSLQLRIGDSVFLQYLLPGVSRYGWKPVDLILVTGRLHHLFVL